MLQGARKLPICTDACDGAETPDRCQDCVSACRQGKSHIEQEMDRMEAFFEDRSDTPSCPPTVGTCIGTIEDTVLRAVYNRSDDSVLAFQSPVLDDLGLDTHLNETITEHYNPGTPYSYPEINEAYTQYLQNTFNGR